MLIPPAPQDGDLEIVYGSQHASLMIIREVWKQLHPQAPADAFKIFLQDPWYDERDVNVAKHFDMTVVNAGMGYHVGFLRINARSLVVQFAAQNLVPIYQMALEIVRNASHCSSVSRPS